MAGQAASYGDVALVGLVQASRLPEQPGRPHHSHGMKGGGFRDLVTTPTMGTWLAWQRDDRLSLLHDITCRSVSPLVI